MKTKTEDIYKSEIAKRLSTAKSLVEQVVKALESENDWKDIHAKTEMAIMHLRKATKLLAQYHLEICIIEKRRKMNMQIGKEDIEEIIKTYKYLN